MSPNFIFSLIVNQNEPTFSGGQAYMKGRLKWNFWIFFRGCVFIFLGFTLLETDLSTDKHKPRPQFKGEIKFFNFSRELTVKECHLSPWIKRNNFHNTFFMGRNDCHLFGIKFVFQGLSYRVTIPDILKLQVLHFFRPRAHPWPPKKEAFPQCKIVTYDANFLGGHGCAHKNQIVTLLHCIMNL